MTTGLASAPAVTASAPSDLPDAVRVGTMAAILLVMVVGADPFHDRTAVTNIESGAGGNLVNQILFLLVGAATVALVARRGVVILRPLVTLPLAATLAWFCVSTATSVDPAASARRLLSLLIMMGGAVAVLTLARDTRQFANVLAGTVLAVLAASYLGLLLAPDLATHTALDLREPEHAGSWRGVWAHKNAAGALMAPFAFVGLFCARAGQRWLGVAVTVLAVVFLAFTNAKTSLALAPVALALTFALTLSPAGWWRRGIVLVPLALLLAATVGSVLVPALGALGATFAGDPTFTGRSEIWEFAFDNIQRRPLTGFGYGAFWESVYYGGGSDAASWVNTATATHDGYLNTALETGLPGLALTVWWFVLRPLADLQGAAGGRRVDPLSLLFLQIWLFGLLAAVFETILYSATDGLFFLMTVSVFGLRYRAFAVPRQAGPARG